MWLQLRQLMQLHWRLSISCTRSRMQHQHNLSCWRQQNLLSIDDAAAAALGQSADLGRHPQSACRACMSVIQCFKRFACRQVVNNIVGAALARQNEQERALQERRDAAKRALEEAAAKVGPTVKSECTQIQTYLAMLVVSIKCTGILW